MTLSDILHPISLDCFLSEYFNAAPLHVPGPASRFAAFTAPLANQSPGIAELVHNLELDLEAPVRPAGQTDWRGLPLHRGERDLLILQTAGSDLWQVHGRQSDQSSTEPTWHAVLEDGGALYLPRGWWYGAQPQRTPSLNVTLQIENPTGADLLFWLAEKLKRHEAFAADIPRFAGPAAKSAFLVAVRQALLPPLRMPGLLERYARHVNRRVPVAVPPGVTPLSEAASRNGWIAFAAPRRPQIWRGDAETIDLRAGDVRLPFPLDAAPLLHFLIDQVPVAVAAMYREFAGEFDPDEIADLLAVLQRAGVIRLTAADSLI